MMASAETRPNLPPCLRVLPMRATMPGMTLDDDEAVRRLKSGDIGGLQILVRRYQVRAVRAAFLVTQDEPLAEDVVQDAFIHLHQRINQFDDRRPLEPYLMRSVINPPWSPLLAPTLRSGVLREGDSGGTIPPLRYGMLRESRPPEPPFAKHPEGKAEGRNGRPERRPLFDIFRETGLCGRSRRVRGRSRARPAREGASCRDRRDQVRNHESAGRGVHGHRNEG